MPLCVIAALSAGATDYTSLNGKCGAELKSAVKQLSGANFKSITYGDKTWEAFETTDIRMVQGRAAWFDMYSNRLVYVSSGHGGMNIEHSVANSWWGGVKNNAYKDLYHLNPSDADANNRKNNNPLGEISGTPTWSNGLTNIGAPTMTTGGGASTVFEPADEYKGDFARAYFYIFTLYDDISWEETPAYMYELSAFPTLKPWATEMLLRWAAEDPVDERELSRAKAVSGIQMNVNPYVEIPDLAEYVWGSKNTTAFSYTEPVYAPNRPDAPVFIATGSADSDYTLAGVNTWTGRWWDAFSLELTSDADDIYYSFGDTDAYRLYTAPINIAAAQSAGETISFKAFARTKYNGTDYDSSVSSLTLTAREAGKTDYMHARWEKVVNSDNITDSDIYIITYEVAENNTVMAATAAGTSSSKYVNVAGETTNDSGVITYIPENTGLVRLVSAGGNQYYVSVNDITLKNVGYLYSTAAKSLQIAEEGTEVSIKLSPDKTVAMDFGTSVGTLQYNKQSPRFSAYTSAQQKVTLYRCISDEGDISTVVFPTVASAEEPAIWYDLNGRRIDIDRAEPGIYIRLSDGRPLKIRKK